MSIILYESYALKRQKLAPARVKDTERALTITLAAGRGTVIDAWAKDEATMAKITKAYPGQEIRIEASIKNMGDADWIWVTVKDKDTGIIIKNKAGIPYSYEAQLSAGGSWVSLLPHVIMPNKTWNLLVEAGHGRA